MAIGNSEKDWGVVSKALHWLIALMVAGLVGVGWYMTDLRESTGPSPQVFELYALHKSVGVTVFLLMIARLLWRLANPTPRLPAHMAGWERTAAIGTHWALYALLLGMPISGYVVNAAARFPLNVFDLFTVPRIIDPSPDMGELAATMHGLAGWVLVGMVAVHAGAALRHHFLKGDDILVRMLPFGSARR
jgi:cytochrome b561